MTVYKMFRAFMLWILLVGWTVSVSECSLTIPGWFSWTPQGSNRTDLYCEASCQQQQWKEECCSCNSRTCYEIIPVPAGCNDTIANLIIEYISLSFDSMLDVGRNETNATYFNLIHTNGRMTSLPVNICAFPNLIRIEVHGNRIESIGNISCVKELNILDLSKNSIRYVSNETFTNMTMLRLVDLSHNSIEVLEPNTFLKHGGNIFTVDMSYSDIYELDVTNVMVEGPFCDRNFRHSILEDPSNKYDFKIDKSKHYGPGEVDFSNSTMDSFMNFTDLGVDYQDMERYSAIGFLQNGVNLICDCHMVPFLQTYTYPAILRFMPELGDDIFCQAPERMKGIALNALNFKDELDSLTCGLTEFCPYKCTCTDLQSQKRVIVNCTNAGLTSLPEYMPVGAWNSRELDLILDGNNIKHLDNREYLNRVNSLTLSGNPIQTISDAAIGILTDDVMIDLSHSVSRTLPKALQNKNPNQITFGSAPILCDCSNVWIGAWLRNHDAFNKLKCEIDGQIVNAESITDRMLGCIPEEGLSPLAVALSVIFAVLFAVTLSTLLYLTRIELHILSRRFMQWTREREPHLPELLYHMYVIFDEDNDEPLVTKATTGRNICEWIRCELKPYLNKEGLENYVPYLDMLLGTGENKEDQMYQAISDSEAYVVIYTAKFFDRSDTRRQFESVWTQFKKFSHKSIFVINLDSTLVSQVPDRRMRALFRVGYFLDYTITTARMVDRLVERYHSIYLIDKTDDGVQEDVNYVHPAPNYRHVYPLVAASPANRAFNTSIFNQTQKFNMHEMQAADDEEPEYEEETKTNAYLPVQVSELSKRNISRQYDKRSPNKRVPVMGLDSKGIAKRQLDVLHDTPARVGSAKSSSSVASISNVPLKFIANRSREIKPKPTEPFFSNHYSDSGLEMESKRMRPVQDRPIHASISTNEEHLRSRGSTNDNIQRYGPPLRGGRRNQSYDHGCPSRGGRRNQSYDRITSLQSQSSTSTTPVSIHHEWSPPIQGLARSQTPIEELEDFHSDSYDDTTYQAAAGNRWMTATPVIHSEDSSPIEGRQYETSGGARNEKSYSRYMY